MRDATTSSASSSTGRPSFAGTPARQDWEAGSDPPSTPPEQADDDEDLPGEPEHQRDVHQKKRRRVSAVPPMNFNNPEDEFSSSPVSGSSLVEGSSDMDMEDEEGEDEDGESDDGESTAMSLDTGDNTMQSEETESTDSSLTARLRQAAVMAGTRGIEYDEHGEYQVNDEEEDDDDEEDDDENGDMTMDMVTQEVTNAFKPWAQQSYGPPPMAKNIIALQDQENMNPFSPAFRQAYSYRKPQGVPSTVGEETEPDSGEVSMDMTCAVGGILQSNQSEAQSEEDENENENENDMSMDITRAVGGILPPPQLQPQQTRIQEVDEDDAEEENDMSMDMTRAVGGILPSQEPDEDTRVFGDQTMDFTQAIGNIMQPSASRPQPPRSAMKRRHSATDHGSPHTSEKSPAQPPQRRTVAQATSKRRRSSAARSSLGDATMDFTMAVGSINANPSPVKQDRRASLRRRRSSGLSSAMDEQTMDFTTAVGGIRQAAPLSLQGSVEEENEDSDENEDLSMDFTAVIGGIASQEEASDTQRPVTPRECPSPARTEIPTTPSHEGHFKEAEDRSAKKLLTPMFEQQVPGSAIKDSAGSRKTSARKSIGSAKKSPASSRKSPASTNKSPASTVKNFMPNVKSPAASVQSPFVVFKSSTSPQKVPSSAQKEPKSAQKSPARPILAPKSPASLHKSPASARKSPASTRKSPASARKQRQSLVPPTFIAEEPQDENIISQPADELTQSFSPERDQEEPGEPMEEIVYPTLPVQEPLPSPVTATPVVATPVVTIPIATSPAPAGISQAHHLHTVSEAGSPLPASAQSPEEIDMEEANPPSPSLDKQMRSSPVKNARTPQQHVTPQAATTPFQAQSSPVREAMTPQQSFVPDAPSMTPQPQVAFEEPSRPITNFSTSLKMMSTPRKESGTSPLKRLRGMTPMKSPAKKPMTPHKAFTPKSKTPQFLVKSSAAEMAGQQLAQELFAATRTGQQIPKVKLNDFLDMAGIKFMELAMPTKRRFTVAPPAGRADPAGDDSAETNVELESAVVAGACTMPMLDLFQHACRELKRYISEGKSFVKTLESDVLADPPPLISAYVSASPQRKAQLDGHMRDIKTNARLRSKEVWYEWRSKLLDGLEDGLKGIQSGLENDAKVLGDREQLLDSLLPDLLARHESLGNEASKLEEAAAATSEEEKEELDASRERLVDVDVQIAERKRMLASFQQELQEQESLAEAYNEGKAECIAQIQEAERVKESCRGWSIDEVTALKGTSPQLLSVSILNPRLTLVKESVSNLESQTGWTITSASSSTLTMVYRSSLSLFFDTAAFLLPNVSAAAKKENQPISLTYVATSPSSTNGASGALPTETRFFLQLMRAHLQCLEQKTTKVKDLLKFVSGGWDIASNISEAVRRLRIEYPVDVAILSDEKLGVKVQVLLPRVQSKVAVGFEISAAIVGAGEEGGRAFEVGTNVEIKGNVVYGEGYNEKNMEGFLGRRCGCFGEGWEDAVRELRVKLVATGRKG